MRVGCPLSAISRHWLSGTCHFNLHRGSCYGNAQGSALGTLNGERSMAVQPATHARCALVPPRPGLAAKTEPRHCRAQSGWLARCRAQPWFLGDRNLIERFFNKIKQCRRVATRYDKLAANYLAFVKLACIRLWLRVYECTA